MKNISKKPVGASFISQVFQTYFLTGCLALLCCLVLSSNTKAATFTVNTLADNEANTCAVANCTMREAVTDANVLAGADNIVFQAGLTGTINLIFGELVVTDSVAVTGPGARLLTLDGQNIERVFRINGAGVVVNISRLTAANGRASTGIFLGGGVYAQANTTVNLDSVTIRNCRVFGRGAGVAVFPGATMTITNSTISDNVVEGTTFDSGGVINGGTLSISNSTISGNSAQRDAGINNSSGATLTLNNTTITNNTAVNRAGGVVNNGVANIRNTIIAKNNASLNPDFEGAVNSLGNNLIGNDSGSGFVNGVNGDIAGTAATPVDPILGALANNGGPTDTHAVLFLSPALNAGDDCVITLTCASDNPPSALTLDQRGTPRSQGAGGVDIGAYESSLVPTSASVSVSGRVMSGKRGIAGARVYLTDQGGETRTALTNAFGYYGFDDVSAGETYFFTAASKGYSFEMQIITVIEDISGFDFIAGQVGPLQLRL